MAPIAEELLLLLLDNASGRPGLDRLPQERLLTTAVLLDLAHACRIRPTTDGEPVPAGRLVMLSGTDPVDPAMVPAVQLLARQPVSPAEAVTKLRRRTAPALFAQLERSGQIRPVPLRTKGFVRCYAWPLTDRTRVETARSALLAALFDHQRPDPTTASVITLLHTVDGLGAILSLNRRGWGWVHSRAAEIASGSWVGEAEPDLAEVNLLVTTAALRPALAQR